LQPRPQQVVGSGGGALSRDPRASARTCISATARRASSSGPDGAGAGSAAVMRGLSAKDAARSLDQKNKRDSTTEIAMDLAQPSLLEKKKNMA
jgi:hypothetical protein